MSRVLQLTTFLVVAVALALPVAAVTVDELPEKYQAWLAEVAPIITPEERQAFLDLEEDYQRDAFIERFWRARDPYPATARNEFRERWEQRIAQVRAQFSGLNDARAQILLINGAPDARVVPRCRGSLWPMDLWFYRGTERIRGDFAIIFYQRLGSGPYRIWTNFDGIEALAQFPNSFDPRRSTLEAIDRCIDGDAIFAALRLISNRGNVDYSSLLAKLREPPAVSEGEEWVTGFSTYSTEVAGDAERFEAELSVDYPGPHQQRTLVQAVLQIPQAEVQMVELGESRTYDFSLTGEVLRDGSLFENFRYRFQIPAVRVDQAPIPLVFERALRPGRYRLVLKLEDLGGDSFFRVNRAIEVPDLQDGTPSRVPLNPEMAALVAEANTAILSGEATIQIVPPRGQLLTGPVRFDTLTTGDEIAEVAFRLDGHTLLRKNQPPYSVELDLGQLPRMHELEVRAHDAQGQLLARDVTTINAGSHRFAVRLLEPSPDTSYSQSLRAVAQVSVPEGGAVERLEFYLNETLVATLFQEPWEQPILLSDGGGPAYVRAVAYQPDGNRAEDVAFINTPGFGAEVEVQFVELYMAVTDRARRPIEGLERSDFTVLEGGVQQTPVRFNVVSDLPIHAALMLDTSASMTESLELAQGAALGFLEAAIHPKDRAAVLTFNDLPQLAVRFTNEMQPLAAGLAGLTAERGTALWDSLIYGLYYFNGIEGQRALIVLSDGKDESSRYGFEEALEYARRSGVTLYTIGLGIEARSARKRLERLAQESGGRAFQVSSAAQLSEIYQTIQRELRSRYYLAYQSTNTATEDEFRRIEVRVDAPGARVQTIRGYYP